MFGAILINNFTLNVSNSLPRGIYKTYKIERDIRVGDIVVFKPTQDIKVMLSKYQSIKLVPLLMKQVIGISGDEFTYQENKVIKNKKEVIGYIREKDFSNNLLPHYGEVKLLNDEFYVIGTHPNSFDSKYYGAIKREDILKFAKPIFIF